MEKKIAGALNVAEQEDMFVSMVVGDVLIEHT
jgi:hypothetical protein